MDKASSFFLNDNIFHDFTKNNSELVPQQQLYNKAV